MGTDSLTRIGTMHRMLTALHIVEHFMKSASFLLQPAPSLFLSRALQPYPYPVPPW